jgi:two-component sensor histidine kinase
MKNLLIFILFVLVCNIKLLSQNNCNCESVTKQTQKEFNKANATGKFVEARIVITAILKSNDDCCKAIGFSMEAILCNSEGKTNESFEAAKKAQTHLKKAYSTYAAIESNRLIAMYYNKAGKADSAILMYYKSLAIAEKENDQLTIAKIYSNIASVFMNQKQKEKGLDMIKKSLAAALLTNDTVTIAQSYSNLVTSYGEVYDMLKKQPYLDSMKQFAEVSLVYAKASKMPINMIRYYLSMTKYALSNNNDEQAIAYSDSLLTFIDNKTNPVILNSVFIDRGEIHLRLKQYPQAISFFAKAYNASVVAKNQYMKKNIYAKLYEAYKANNQIAPALDNLEKYKNMSDSLLSKENAEVINEMEGKYNQAKNENKIKDLDKKKQFYLFLAIAGLLAALAIAFFLRQQKLKHKKNILETEQRLNRARMNPHFFFNALASLQKFALKENDPQAMASNLSKFSNIMRETLESTYKEYVTIEQEIEFLNEYLEVQKIRFPQAFTYIVSADKNLDIDELQIPAMIIQPFVENSIEHGFVGVDYPGNVTIKFASENKELLIEIKDNGKGLNTTVKENNEHISRASQIIKDRIYLLNIKLKTKAGFRIDNAEGGGVIVKIHLPLLYKEQKSS